MNIRKIAFTLFAAILCLASCNGKKGQAVDSEPVPLEWRGVMIDASRHFWPVDVLHRQVDLMGRYGLNILHLHLTDAAGWRLEIRKYPRLTDMGAWRTHKTWKEWWAARPKAEAQNVGVEWFAPAYADSISGYGGYYTRAEMRELVQYAAEWGVTIIPEIEFPAHSEEVVAAYPWLGYSHSELNMSLDSTYIFMADVLAEVAEIFPGPYIHVGGDESETQKGQHAGAMRRIQKIVEGLGKKMIVWDEALTDEPADSGQVIMVWRDINTAAKAIRLGHEVVVCPGNWCYLDSYQDCPAGQPETMGGYRPLEHCFSLPLDSALAASEEGKGRLLGLQTCLFTEYVPTPEVLEYQLWPRALVAAELGLGRNRSYEEFHRNAMEITDLMRSEGINAFDLRHEQGQRPEAEADIAHKGIGAKVIYNKAYNPYYPASGDSALVDGRRGTWSNNDGRWQGFSRDIDFMVNMEAESEVSSVELAFMQIIGPEIFLPATVEVALLDNEEDKGPVSKSVITLPDPLTDIPYVIHPYKATFSPAVRAKYIHITASRTPRAGWLFTDEVVIE